MTRYTITVNGAADTAPGFQTLEPALFRARRLWARLGTARKDVAVWEWKTRRVLALFRA